MRCGVKFVLVILGLASALALRAEKKEGPSPHTAAVLQEYDQSLDQIAEHAMRSVVQIDVPARG